MLVLVLSLPGFNKAVTYLDFTINQDFIAEFLCINKDKPAMQCNGKCHLAQELKQTERQDSDQAPTQVEEKRLTLFVSNEVPKTLFSAKASTRLNAWYLPPHSADISTSIDRPPQTV